jgi:hypothetical protein
MLIGFVEKPHLDVGPEFLKGIGRHAFGMKSSQ